MTTVLVGMAVCVTAALLVLALVAVPRVRGGEKLFTADGEETVRGASRRARALATQAVDRAGEMAGDVRDKAEEARSRRAAANEAANETANEADQAASEARQADSEDTDADAWSAPTAVRPAAPAHGRQPARGPEERRGRSGARTATLAAPLAVSPAEEAAASNGDRSPRVIDLREPRAESRTGASPDPATATELPSRRDRRHREADLGWGEPRPGPRHSR